MVNFKPPKTGPATPKEEFLFITILYLGILSAQEGGSAVGGALSCMAMIVQMSDAQKNYSTNVKGENNAHLNRA